MEKMNSGTPMAQIGLTSPDLAGSRLDKDCNCPKEISNPDTGNVKTFGLDRSATENVVLNSFEPSEGVPGTIVTIRGANFNEIPSHNFVFFEGDTKERLIPGRVISSSPTQLNVIVPDQAVTGPILVDPATSIKQLHTIFSVVRPDR